MVYFDTHIHLQDFKKTEILSMLENAKIRKCICVSAKQSDWEKVANLYEKYADIIIPSFGLHPWYANAVQSGWQNELEFYLSKYPSSLVGECGFDRLKAVDYATQKDVFLSQINLARKYNKGLIIHAVKADEWLNDVWKLLPSKFVFHSFNARTNLLKKVLNNGGYVAFNKKVLKNKQINDFVLALDINRLLLETDAPYQSQVEDLDAFIESLSVICNEKLEVLIKRLYANATEFVENGK